MDVSILNQITKYGFILKQGSKIYANKRVIELLGLRKRNLLNDLNKIEEIKEFLNSKKGVFKEIVTIKTKIETKHISFYIKKTIDGFILLADDFTKYIREKHITDIVIYMNDVLAKSKNENELYEKFIKAVIKKAKFNACFVMKKQKNALVPVAWGNDTDGLDCIKDVTIPLDEKTPLLKTPVAKAFLEGNIFFNDDTRINPDVEPLREEMLKRNYLSSVGIPIFKGKKVEAVICICKDEVDFFKGYKKLIEYISKALSKTFENLEEIKFKNVLLSAINKGHEWVVITDKNGKIVFVNETVEKITGYKKSELIGKNPKIFKSGLHDEMFYKELWETIKKGKIFESVIINKKRDGSIFYLLDKIVPVGDYYISLGKDITNEKKYFHLIEELKFKDPITGLYNKEGFFKHARDYLKKFKYESHIVLVVDVYNFNVINHKYGISEGDEVLKQLGKKLRTVFFERDLIYKFHTSNITLGRFNGDEFAIFLEKADEECIPKILNKLYEAFNGTYKVKNEKIKLDYNAGISLYPKDASDIEDLLNNASLALLNAKKEGPNIVKLYSKEYSKEIYKFNDVLNLIKTSLEKNRFELFFQPIVDAEKENIVAAEGLLRIRKKSEIITPGVFIDVLENSNYSLNVAMKMLDNIENILKTTKDIKISYNLCEKQFRNTQMIDKLINIGKKFPYRLQIELIERVLINEKLYSQKVLEKLKDNGILIAIDDFGTGYSSLSYIRELPVDIIKIDISFIRKMMQNHKDMAIVKTIINLAKELGIKTVAEGVEDESQVAILKALGCDYIQGFYYYKPMPKEEFLKLL